MADVNNPQGLVWNPATGSFKWPGMPGEAGMNIPPPPPATQSFPGPGLYSINGKMWPIQDAEQWAAYAQYNPTFVAGPGAYGMNAQGGYAPLAAPVGIPGAAPSGIPAPTNTSPPVAPPPGIPGGQPSGVPLSNAPPVPSGIPIAPGSGPITAPPTGNVAPLVLPPGVPTGVPPGIPGSTNVNVQTTIPWPGLTEIEAQGRISREITDANNAAAAARLNAQIAQQSGDLAARDKWATEANRLDQKRYELESQQFTLSQEIQRGQLGVSQAAQRAQEVYQTGTLGVSQQAQALAREYQMGQLGIGQAAQRAQEAQFGQTYGLQQQVQELARQYQMGQLGVSQAAQQAQVSQAAQQYGLQGRAQALAEQQAASASDLGWSQYLSNLLTNPQYASNLQSMRANSPQLVSAIEGRGIDFQKLLESRILMPQAPGR